MGRELFEARKDQFEGFEVWKGARMIIQEPPPVDKGSPARPPS
jgi:hypothetical protein